MSGPRQPSGEDGDAYAPRNAASASLHQTQQGPLDAIFLLTIGAPDWVLDVCAVMLVLDPASSAVIRMPFRFIKA